MDLYFTMFIFDNIIIYTYVKKFVFVLQPNLSALYAMSCDQGF